MKTVPRLGFALGAVLIIAGLTPLSAANAEVAAPPAPVSDHLSSQQLTGTVSSENDLGLLVTPTELQQLGASRQEIAKQTALFNTLSPTQLTAQAQLQKAQAAEKERLAALPDVPVSPAATSVQSEPNGMTPYIYITVCWPGNDYYSVYWTSTGPTVDCFADSGTWNAAPSLLYETTAVRPGNNVGRVYYPDSAYWYWSPWRGKTMDTYYFNGSVTVYKVQIQ